MCIDDVVQCTYVTIPQVTHTAAVVLSKPAWTWGAATGSNEHGVCISVEAVQTKLLTDEATSKELLLGVDLVRWVLLLQLNDVNVILVTKVLLF